MPRHLAHALCLLLLPTFWGCAPTEPDGAPRNDPATASATAPAPPEAATPPAPSAQTAVPAALAPARDDFLKYCASCHGDGGRGDGPMGRFLDPNPKDLTDVAYMSSRTDEQIYRAIHDGGAAVGLSDKMAAWSHLLSEEQIRELANYVRWLSEGDGA